MAVTTSWRKNSHLLLARHHASRSCAKASIADDAALHAQATSKGVGTAIPDDSFRTRALRSLGHPAFARSGIEAFVIT